jgi:uncharacterized membrane protein YgcG
MLKMFRLVFWIVLALVSLVVPSLSEEVIDRFISNVTVNVDGTLDVTEDITVLAEARQIRHGILRDFPTDYATKDGTQVRTSFELKQALHNGVAVEWQKESLPNGVRIRLGSAGRLLQPGYHTFTLMYQTDRQIGFFADHDELYWNVTGNGWTFPINEVSASIILPDGARIGSKAFYSGYKRHTGQNGRIASETSNSIRLMTASPLRVGEGFTIAVGWQKGILRPPSPSQEWLWWLRDNASLGVLAATLAASLLYYFITWSRVGRDPPAGTTIPLFRPPDKLDPATTRYAWRDIVDDVSFASAVVNLAVKGGLRIEQDGHGYNLVKAAGTVSSASAAEQALLGALPQGVTEIDQTNRDTFQKAKSVLDTQVERTFERPLIIHNMGWFALGVALSAAGLVLAGYLMQGGMGSAFLFGGLFSAVWWIVILGAAWGTVQGFWKGRGLLAGLFGVGKLVFLIPFAIGGIAVPIGVMSQGQVSGAGLAFFAMAVILLVENFAFYKLLPAATQQGRRLLDQIEGFRLYLTTAEEKRLDALNPPEKTPELFERYLPYAMALDCENQWNEKFANVLAAAAAAGAAAPIWYSGSRSFGSGDFAQSLGSGLASSVSSASTPPGSSSGSSGGGFSGGGGGGGGGSGW